MAALPSEALLCFIILRHIPHHTLGIAGYGSPVSAAGTSGQDTHGPFCQVLAKLSAGRREFRLAQADESLQPVVQAMIDAASQSGNCFVPMEHLNDVLRSICCAILNLNASTARPKAFLLTGPKGIGKTSLLKAISQPAVLSEVCKLGGNIGAHAIAVYISLGARAFAQSTSFSTRLLTSVVAKLTELDPKRFVQLQAFVKALLDLSKTVPFPTALDFSAAGFYKHDIVAPAAQADRVPAALKTSTQCNTYLLLLDSALKASKCSLLVFVDEADALFQAAHFSAEAAASWTVDMRHIFDLNSVGLVMCTSFQRAHHLFLSEPDNIKFPDKYTYLKLGSWNSSKLSHLQMSPPGWTSECLTEFILARSLNALGLPVTADSMAQAEAARLDSIFSGATIGKAAGPHNPDMVATHHKNSLNMLLSVHGHNPRHLSKLVEACLNRLPCFSDIPTSTDPARQNLPSDEKVAGQLRRALDAYWGILDKPRDQRMRNPTYAGCFSQLNHNFSLFAVDQAQIMKTLVSSGRLVAVEAASHTASGAAVSPQEAFEAIRLESEACLNTALDHGHLVCLADGRVTASDPSVILRLVCQESCVSTTAPSSPASGDSSSSSSPGKPRGRSLAQKYAQEFLMRKRQRDDSSDSEPPASCNSSPRGSPTGSGERMPSQIMVHALVQSVGEFQR